MTVIDGQQSLTTLTLIYLVLYKLANELYNEELLNEISEAYLINKFSSEEEKLKLLPTDNNNNALKHLSRNDAQEEYPDFSKLIG